MAFIGQSFHTQDLPQNDTGEFTPLPEGWYDVTVAKSELKSTKDGSGKFISLRLKVTGPTHAGRGVFTNLNIINRSPDAERIGRAQLRSVLECANIAELTDTDQLMGASFSVKLTIRPPYVDKTGVQRDADNEVKGYRPIAGASMPASIPPAHFAPPAYQAPTTAHQAPAYQPTPAATYQPQSAAANQPAPAVAAPPWQQPQGQQPAAPAVGAAPPWAAR